MQAYSYNPTTGEYEGIVECQPDPRRQGNYLLPAHSTPTAPPSQSLQHAVYCWNQQKWTVVQDYRGEEVWKDHDQSIEIKELGPLPEGYSLQRPPYKVTHQDLVQLCYEEKSRIAYGGLLVRKGESIFKFQTSQDSIAMCNATLAYLSTQGEDASVSWKVWDGDQPLLVQLTKSQFLYLFSRGMEMINTSFAVQDAVNKAYAQYTQNQLSKLSLETQKLKLERIFDQIDITATLEDK